MQVKAYPRAKMEGECYALIWVVMHFRQYLHHIDFILCMDHKPLEWLLIVSEAHGKRGCLLNMLQEFSLSRSSTWQEANIHTDTLSRNLVGMLEEDEDFQVEIPDMKVMTFSAVEREEEWRGMRCHDLTLNKCGKCLHVNFLLWDKSSDFVRKKSSIFQISLP